MMSYAYDNCWCGAPILYYDELNPQARSCYMLTTVLHIDVEVRSVQEAQMSGTCIELSSGGTRPTLIDGNITLDNGHTIMMYLCDMYACLYFPHMCPCDYLTRLELLNVLFYEAGHLYRTYNHLMFEILLKKYQHVDMDYHRGKVVECYNTLNSFLEDHAFMVGNCLTIADFSIITTVGSLDLIFPISQDQWPNLYRWFENMKKMDCYGINQEGIDRQRHLLATMGQFPIASEPAAADLCPSLQRSTQQKGNDIAFPSPQEWVQNVDLFKNWEIDNPETADNHECLENNLPSKNISGIPKRIQSIKCHNSTQNANISATTEDQNIYIKPLDKEMIPESEAGDIIDNLKNSSCPGKSSILKKSKTDRKLGSCKRNGLQSPKNEMRDPRLRNIDQTNDCKDQATNDGTIEAFQKEPINQKPLDKRKCVEFQCVIDSSGNKCCILKSPSEEYSPQNDQCPCCSASMQSEILSGKSKNDILDQGKLREFKSCLCLEKDTECDVSCPCFENKFQAIDNVIVCVDESVCQESNVQLDQTRANSHYNDSPDENNCSCGKEKDKISLLNNAIDCEGNDIRVEASMCTSDQEENDDLDSTCSCDEDESEDTSEASFCCCSNDSDNDAAVSDCSDSSLSGIANCPCDADQRKSVDTCNGNCTSDNNDGSCDSMPPDEANCKNIKDCLGYLEQPDLNFEKCRNNLVSGSLDSSSDTPFREGANCAADYQCSGTEQKHELEQSSNCNCNMDSELILIQSSDNCISLKGETMTCHCDMKGNSCLICKCYTDEKNCQSLSANDSMKDQCDNSVIAWKDSMKNRSYNSVYEMKDQNCHCNAENDTSPRKDSVRSRPTDCVQCGAFQKLGGLRSSGLTAAASTTKDSKFGSHVTGNQKEGISGESSIRERIACAPTTAECLEHQTKSYKCTCCLQEIATKCPELSQPRVEEECTNRLTYGRPSLVTNNGQECDQSKKPGTLQVLSRTSIKNDKCYQIMENCDKLPKESNEATRSEKMETQTLKFSSKCPLLSEPTKQTIANKRELESPNERACGKTDARGKFSHPEPDINLGKDKCPMLSATTKQTIANKNILEGPHERASGKADDRGKFSHPEPDINLGKENDAFMEKREGAEAILNKTNTQIKPTNLTDRAKLTKPKTKLNRSIIKKGSPTRQMSLANTMENLEQKKTKNTEKPNGTTLPKLETQANSIQNTRPGSEERSEGTQNLDLGAQEDLKDDEDMKQQSYRLSENLVNLGKQTSDNDRKKSCKPEALRFPINEKENNDNRKQERDTSQSMDVTQDKATSKSSAGLSKKAKTLEKIIPHKNSENGKGKLDSITEKLTDSKNNCAKESKVAMLTGKQTGNDVNKSKVTGDQRQNKATAGRIAGNEGDKVKTTYDRRQSQAEPSGSRRKKLCVDEGMATSSEKGVSSQNECNNSHLFARTEIQDRKIPSTTADNKSRKICKRGTVYRVKDPLLSPCSNAKRFHQSRSGCKENSNMGFCNVPCQMANSMCVPQRDSEFTCQDQEPCNNTLARTNISSNSNDDIPRCSGNLETICKQEEGDEETKRLRAGSTDGKSQSPDGSGWTSEESLEGNQQRSRIEFPKLDFRDSHSSCSEENVTRFINISNGDVENFQKSNLLSDSMYFKKSKIPRLQLLRFNGNNPVTKSSQKIQHLRKLSDQRYYGNTDYAVREGFQATSRSTIPRSSEDSINKYRSRSFTVSEPNLPKLKCNGSQGKSNSASVIKEGSESTMAIQPDTLYMNILITKSNCKNEFSKSKCHRNRERYMSESEDNKETTIIRISEPSTYKKCATSVRNERIIKEQQKTRPASTKTLKPKPNASPSLKNVQKISESNPKHVSKRTVSAEVPIRSDDGSFITVDKYAETLNARVDAKTYMKPPKFYKCTCGRTIPYLYCKKLNKQGKVEENSKII